MNKFDNKEVVRLIEERECPSCVFDDERGLGQGCGRVFGMIHFQAWHKKGIVQAVKCHHKQTKN